jgi:ABC-type dipeptide/oligopeptide/nickel transport system permease subunit
MERTKPIVIKLGSRFMKVLKLPATVWRKLRSDKIIFLTSIVAMFLFLFSVFCYLLIPDKTLYANRLCLPIGNQPPGFEITMLRITENKPTVPQSFFSKLVHGKIPNDMFIPISSSRYEGTDIVIKEFSASGDSSFESRYNIADVVYPLNLDKPILEKNRGLFFETADGMTIEESINDIQGFIDGQHLVKQKFILGTDRFGRDVLSRFLAATRATLFVATLSTLVAIVAGLIFGLLTGIAKRKDKSFLNWLLQSVTSIPAMVLMIAIMFLIGKGFWHVCLVTGFILSREIARVIAGALYAAKEKKFIDGENALGIKKLQIFRRHILPDITRPLLAAAATVFCGAILVESGLSFLDVGMSAAFPSWGSMIRENFGYIIVPGYAYLTLLPGTAIFLVSLLFVTLASRFQKRICNKYYWMAS